ncbi:MAG: putative metal-dependent hydrolase [Acidobacteria bacterium]|nr:putative metal-dependent hydrolase [Acidobacteriota bacterium]MDE3262450.1 putative metal-dependent hydrolase [Acidobacteriota bacterium]MXW39272.1 putative metal-dependent hydrolase [Acidobacteriota bacterium]MXZ60353.1 putative metal-dependent hydrolase [Acidobacteriota bacterium]MYA45371.1 putative metal-dependent hydrolase [Acidobacteriota bacterium]
MASDSADLRFPIGDFADPGVITEDHLGTWLKDLAALPGDLRRTVTPLDDAQLDTPYRPGGWTVRQVVHHLPDSHLNCFLRFRWALTEDRPVIKPYDEAAVAELPDYRSAPVGHSLDLLDTLHARWVDLIQSLTWDQLQRTFVNPESGEGSLARMVGVYAWHGRHHLAHIEQALARENGG